MKSDLTSDVGKVILAVDDDNLILEIVSRVLRNAGFLVVTATDGVEALALLEGHRPDLILSDVDMPNLNGLELVTHLRADPELTRIPVIFLSSLDTTSNIVAGLQLGGDDYLTKPFQAAELVARVQAKLSRVPVPSSLLKHEPGSGLLTEVGFREEMGREFSRFQRGGSVATLAWISLHELASIRLRVGHVAAAKTLQESARRVQAMLRALDLVAEVGKDAIWVLMPETNAEQAKRPLDRLVTDIARRPLDIDGRQLLVTPVIGYCESPDASSSEEWLEKASLAQEFAAGQLDLRPVVMDDRIATWARGKQAKSSQEVGSRWRFALETLRLPFQIGMTFVIGLLLPFFLYVGLDSIGFDITSFVYFVVVVALLTTGALIWGEGLLALRAPHPPDEPVEPYPPASAIIAAYLPNEAATILDTLDTFLTQDYPAGLQVILAYNSPSTLPVESKLRSLTARYPDFLPLKVEGSSSKAQNVNAALEKVSGTFVGVFDADHMPQAGSFQRAWRWLSNGYDIVQGHCMVRNGDSSWIARMVAVEFEAIYAVSHPGRAVMHDFGIFGGSNGFWRTDRLHRIRMRSTMLTEDIDSSMRVIEAGGRIASDPLLISAELATSTFRQLWNQRMRWAQGWFQVSLSHLLPSLRSRGLTLRQKLGMVHLLLWREVYPWLSLQILPIVAFWLTKGRLDWFVPIFVVTTVFTLLVGPGQAVLAYLAAAPEIKRHRPWFVAYLLFSTLFYTEVKNTIVRVAQIKEVMGERNWRVTPRSSSSSAVEQERLAA